VLPCSHRLSGLIVCRFRNLDTGALYLVSSKYNLNRANSESARTICCTELPWACTQNCVPKLGNQPASGPTPFPSQVKPSPYSHNTYIPPSFALLSTRRSVESTSPNKRLLSRRNRCCSGSTVADDSPKFHDPLRRRRRNRYPDPSLFPLSLALRLSSSCELALSSLLLLSHHSFHSLSKYLGQLLLCRCLLSSSRLPL
jgi:hypothetical protein